MIDFCAEEDEMSDSDDDYDDDEDDETNSDDYDGDVMWQNKKNKGLLHPCWIWTRLLKVILVVVWSPVGQ